MCLRSYFEHRLELMAPDETLVLSAEQIRWILAKHGDSESACVATNATGQNAIDSSRPTAAVFSVADLAAAFRTAESSMRALVANGLFGPAEAFRIETDAGSKRKMPYRVPATLVHLARELVQAGQKPGTFCLVPQGGPQSARERTTVVEQAQSTVPHEPLSAAIDAAAPTPATTTAPEPPAAAPAAPAAPAKPKRAQEPPPAIRPAATPRRRRAADGTDLGGWRGYVRKGG
ncbi:MAG TPA: hypothetical protein VHB25_08115 [Gemmatimonadaceae bacterium]|nr:hypothetical protein [Gemmatimonadaceae bacterium]